MIRSPETNTTCPDRICPLVTTRDTPTRLMTMPMIRSIPGTPLVQDSLNEVGRDWRSRHDERCSDWACALQAYEKSAVESGHADHAQNEEGEQIARQNIPTHSLLDSHDQEDACDRNQEAFDGGCPRWQAGQSKLGCLKVGTPKESSEQRQQDGLI